VAHDRGNRRLLSWKRLFATQHADSQITRANFFIAAVVALLAAVLGVVVPDLLTQIDLGKLSPLRWVAQAVLLIALLFLLYRATAHRARVHRRTGTLFYVRVQADTRLDWHENARKAEGRNRMAVRTVTRWINEDAARTPSGIIDLTTICTDVAATLELLINIDRDDTGFTVAPNTPWPVGIALGAALPVVSDLRLLELQGRPSPVALANPSPAMGFTLTRRTPRPAADDGWWKTDVSYEESNLPHAAAHHPRFGLLLALTPAPPRPEMAPEVAFTGTGVVRYAHIQPAFTGTGDGDPPSFTGAELERLAPAVIDRVEHAKRQAIAQEKQLVIVARMPKTIAVALGWGLAQTNLAFFNGTHMLFYRHVMPRPYAPMRVHPAQPTTPATE
jgi:hypothetical protein